MKFKRMITIGFVILIIGLLIFLFFWPIIAIPLLGYYRGPSEFPSDMSKGDEFRGLGTIIESAPLELNEFSVMVIKYDDEKYLFFIEKGKYEKGGRIIVIYKITDADHEESDILKKEVFSEVSKKEAYSLFSHYRTMAFIDDTQEHYENHLRWIENHGVKMTLIQVPEPGGIVGLVIIIVSIIVIIIAVGQRGGGKLREKMLEGGGELENNEVEGK